MLNEFFKGFLYALWIIGVYELVGYVVRRAMHERDVNKGLAWDCPKCSFKVKSTNSIVVRMLRVNHTCTLH